MNQLNLPQWVLDTRFWELDKDGKIYAWIYGKENHSGEFDERLISDSDLLSVHHLLPGMISAMLEYTKARDRHSQLMGNYVLDTFRLLNGDVIEFTNVKGETRRIYDVGVILPIKNNSNYVTISGRQLTTISKNINGQLVDLVIEAERSDNDVAISELESRYPGCEQRWRTVETLELEVGDFEHAIFNKNAPATVISQLDISFYHD